MNLDLFQCPSCRGGLAASSATQVCCSVCGTIVEAKNAILDFVAGHTSTMLDDIDYDEFYRIDDSYSDVLVRSIKSYVGSRWPAPLGTVLEIGCGTGGFSRSLLQIEKPERTVLTDVSPKMLRICQQHLSRIGLLEGTQVSFATYDGANQPLASEVFDTCLGTSVLHHILDVRSCLVDMHRVLKPGGKAFFLEPNLRFHRALYATLADIVAYYLSTGVSADDIDLGRTASWICEVHRIVLHANDLEFLADKEDKHMFRGEEIEALALGAGFDSAEALPATIDPAGVHTAGVYLTQCEVGKGRLNDILRLMPVFQSRYFSLLDAKDRSASFVLAFSKSSSARPGQNTSIHPAAGSSTNFTAHDAKLRCHLTIRTADSNTISVEGWCVAIGEIKWLRLTIDGIVYKVSVWFPRLDVQVAINADGVYPSHHAICSGVNETMTLSAPIRDNTAIAIDVVLANGSVVDVAQDVRLQNDIQRIVSV